MFMLPICAHQRIRLCIRISFVIISILCYMYINIHKYICTYLYIPIWSMRKCTCRHARTRSYICICYIYSKCLCTRITYM